MKIILAIENDQIIEKIKAKEKLNIEITKDSRDLKELIPYVFNVDFLIIDKEFVNDSERLLDIAVEAQKKNIRVVIYTEDIESTEAKKDIGALVAVDVNVFLDINKFDEDELIQVLENYPSEFDYSLLSSDKVKVIEKIVEKEREVEKEVIKTVRNRIITCFSADNGIMVAEVAAEVTNLIATTTGFKTLLIDFNNINPVVADILGVDRNLKNADIYEKLKKQTSLEALVNSIDRNTLNSEIFKELVQRDKKYKFDTITGLYDLVFDDKVNGDHYRKIIDIAKDIYDVVVISTNPYIKNEATYYSLINSTHILGITDNNYTAIYNLLANIKYISPKVVDKEIHIILANNSEYSLAEEKVNELFGNYKIAAYIPIDSNGKRDEYLNKAMLYTQIADEDVKQAYNNIMTSLGYENGGRNKSKSRSLLSFIRR